CSRFGRRSPRPCPRSGRGRADRPGCVRTDVRVWASTHVGASATLLPPDVVAPASPGRGCGGDARRVVSRVSRLAATDQLALASWQRKQGGSGANTTDSRPWTIAPGSARLWLVRTEIVVASPGR